MAEEVPKIAGPGQYRVDVAGESFYRDSLIKICGPRCEGGVSIEVRAELVLQDDNPHDKKAVKVIVNGLQVGHLSCDDARAFRRTVRYGKLSEYETSECAVLIRGGWDRGPGDRGDYGVRLDLPQDDD